MDYYTGPAVLLLDGEQFDVMAFVDSARERGIQEWGGFLETGAYSDVIRHRSLRSSGPDDCGPEVYLRIPGRKPRDIGIVYTVADGCVFAGIGATPLPLPVRERENQTNNQPPT